MNSIFLNNFATVEGGAVKFDCETPIFINNSYENNKAQYGDNIASTPEKLILKVYLKDDEQNSLYDSLEEHKVLFLPNITSGEEIPYILEIIILDQFDQIVSLDYV